MKKKSEAYGYVVNEDMYRLSDIEKNRVVMARRPDVVFTLAPIYLPSNKTQSSSSEESEEEPSPIPDIKKEPEMVKK